MSRKGHFLFVYIQPPDFPGAALDSLGFRELVFIHHAQGAVEILGNVFPLGSGSDALFGAAQFFIIFPAADITYIFHKKFLLGS